MDNPTELVDRLERAAMAYERLGKLSRDDEKTRQMRKDTIAALAETRTAVLGRVATLTAERDEALAAIRARSTAPSEPEPKIVWTGGAPGVGAAEIVPRAPSPSP